MEAAAARRSGSSELMRSRDWASGSLLSSTASAALRPPCEPIHSRHTGVHPSAKLWSNVYHSNAAVTCGSALINQCTVHRRGFLSYGFNKLITAVPPLILFMWVSSNLLKCIKEVTKYNFLCGIMHVLYAGIYDFNTIIILSYKLIHCEPMIL